MCIFVEDYRYILTSGVMGLIVGNLYCLSKHGVSVIALGNFTYKVTQRSYIMLTIL